MKSRELNIRQITDEQLVLKNSLIRLIYYLCMLDKKHMKRVTTSVLVYGTIAAMLLLCLLDMPYGFYSFVRFAAATAFCYLAFVASQSENKERMILFIALAVLFQPFLKIPLGRPIWIIVDVVVAAYLVYLLFLTIGKNHH